jgi:nucleotide-binding universal stress UspA family protein
MPFKKILVPFDGSKQAVRALELKKAHHVLRRLGVKAEFVSALGHPVDIVTKYAKKGKFDLIAMGSKGAGGLERLLLGSVSEGVVHHAHCAVLVVRE